MASSIEVKDLTVRIGGVDVLSKLDLSLAGGKIIGLIGPSGAGKTTLLRVLVGRQRVTVGSVTIFGLPAGSRGLRSQLSYMTQQTSVYADLTVKENLRYFATMVGVSQGKVETSVGEVLETVGLNPDKDRLVAQLSGGQRQRVSLAVSLLGDPRLLVLDEPTVGLDPVLREQLWELFSRLAKAGATLIVSSHVMDEAERCDDLVLLRDGHILAHQTPNELKRSTGAPSVEAGFIQLVEAQV